MMPKDRIAQLRKQYAAAVERQNDLSSVYVGAMNAGDREQAKQFMQLLASNRDQLAALMKEIERVIEDRRSRR